MIGLRLRFDFLCGVSLLRYAKTVNRLRELPFNKEKYCCRLLRIGISKEIGLFFPR